MADSVHKLLRITQSIEEILKEYLQRSRFKRLFRPKSDERLLRKCQEKLQNILEILRVESQIETTTTVDYINQQLTLLQAMLDLRNSQMHGSTSGPSSNAHNNPVSELQMVQGHATMTNIGQYSVARSTNIYIQDNSLVIDGSGNNISMIIGGSHRNN